MFKAYEISVALRYLRAKRQDGFVSIITWLSLIGIALGVATLITVMSVMNGFREEMLGKIMGVNGHIIVMPQYGKTEIANYDKLAQKIEETLGTSLSFRPIPMIESQMMASSEGNSQGAVVRGINRDDLTLISPVAKGILEKSLEKIPQNELIVGYQLLNRLGASINDEITLTSAKGNITAFGTVPRMKGYPVGGSFKTGMSIYDSTFIFMDMAALQSFSNMEGKVNHIELFIKSPDSARELAAKLKKSIPQSRIYTWLDTNSSFVSALNVERNMMFLILTLIILVASFNIISSLIMLVKDKAKDIAVFKTFGVSRSGIMRIFFITGGIIGLIGTALGTALGIWVAKHIELVRQFLQSVFGVKLFPDDVYFLSEMPSRLVFPEVAAVAGMSLLISFLATLYPSLKAARQEAVETLRYE